MTDPLTPREKVELKPCPFCGGRAETSSYSGNPVLWCKTDGCEALMGGEEYCGTEDELVSSWNRRTALASGSGDHAELARLADDLRKFEHHAVGSLKIDMGEARRIIAVCDAHIALLAENAALRASVVRANDGFEEYERRFYLEQERATEAERKLAEAVGLLREWMGTWFVDADSRGENAIADDTRKFLSKEAERG